jgi:hypothetical protein
MEKLIKLARKMEKDMFELAPDRAAYYHLLTENIYIIQEQLHRKNRGLHPNELVKIVYG